jgi:hypothetical protein
VLVDWLKKLDWYAYGKSLTRGKYNLCSRKNGVLLTDNLTRDLYFTALFMRLMFGNDRLVKPLLTHAKPPLTETLPNWCLPLARLLTTEEQMGRVSVAVNNKT